MLSTVAFCATPLMGISCRAASTDATLVPWKLPLSPGSDASGSRPSPSSEMSGSEMKSKPLL
jgi:hypothetical protein